MLIKKVNAFTDSIYGGNPAGVVIKPSKLTDEIMKKITRKIKVSETAFVYPSKIANFKLRFFSPKVEVDLCGHATIATFFTLAEEGILKSESNRMTITQETKAGILPVDIFFENKLCERVMMQQKSPIILDCKINIAEIANSLGVNKNEIDESLPTQIVSTGLFTLPICLKSLSFLKKIRPNFEKIKNICLRENIGSFHIFSFETIEDISLYHARNFAPCYGINEDPVTGTANGALSYYLFKNNIIKEKEFICEQGDIIGRPGRVFINVGTNCVYVGGRAKFVSEFEL